MGGLIAINGAESQYSSKYNQGFSPNLKALGPSTGSGQPDASAAGLINGWLASGTKPGYTFNYSPGPPDAAGHITSYSIAARANSADDPSYYTDESGVIRVTYENRPANAKDPPFAL